MVKAHVLYDKDGNILSVGMLPPQISGTRNQAFGLRPSEGQFAIELELSADQSSIPLSEFSERLKVDTTQYRLVAKG